MSPSGGEQNFGDNKSLAYSVHNKTINAFGKRAFLWCMGCIRAKCDSFSENGAKGEFRQELVGVFTLE